MNKLNLIIKREFLAKVKNKSFILMTFLTPLIIIGIGVLIGFLVKKNNDSLKEIAYFDKTELFKPSDFKNTKTIKYINLSNSNLEETKKKVEKGEYYGLIYIPKAESLELLSKSVEFFSKESLGLKSIEYIEKTIEDKLQSLKMKQLGIDEEKIKSSQITAHLKMYNFSGKESSKLSNQLNVGVGSIAGYLLMMFVILYGSSVMRSVIEEKSSRIIEVIISSVKPFQLMMGKIIGNALAGLLQFSIWVVLIVILSVVSSLMLGINVEEIQQSTNSPEQIEALQKIGIEGQLILQEIIKLPILKLFILFIFYFIGGYMLYSALFAAIGSAVDNEADSNQFVTPIMIPLMLAIYVGAFTVANDPNGVVSVFFSHFPLTSPVVMLMRVPFGVSYLEIVTSMIILTLTFIGVVWLSAKIYRVGILSYGKKPTYKDLWKWIRYNH
ncbi:MAG: ABC transporter permease [Tenacibaculum sp.]|nr:ABC transporter permease [Tenacibaculum sp.]